MPNKQPVLARCPSCAALNRVDFSRLGDGPKCATCATPLAFDHPKQITDADFQKIVDGASVPVVVDFYADWCGPCQAMAPALDAFASTNAGRVLVLKLDTDANQGTSNRFGIRGIPTIISFRDGRELRRHVGMADVRVLASLLA